MPSALSGERPCRGEEGQVLVSLKKRQWISLSTAQSKQSGHNMRNLHNLGSSFFP